jgi:uncharacterized paraquat-inducible protein A
MHLSTELKSVVQQKLMNELKKASILFNLQFPRKPRKNTSTETLEDKLLKIFKDNKINSIEEFDQLILLKKTELKNKLGLSKNDESDLVSLNRLDRKENGSSNMKICSRCNILSVHSVNLRAKSGLQSRCKRCNRQDYQKNKKRSMKRNWKN